MVVAAQVKLSKARQKLLKTLAAGHRRTPTQSAGPVCALGKIAAMISAVNSTCRAEAEPAAEDDAEAEAEAEAGRVHGGNNCRSFLHCFVKSARPFCFRGGPQ